MKGLLLIYCVLSAHAFTIAETLKMYPSGIVSAKRAFMT